MQGKDNEVSANQLGAALIALVPSNMSRLALVEMDVRLEDLAHLTNLVDLYCRGCRVTEGGGCLPVLPRMRTLRFIDGNLGDARKLRLQQYASSLTSLEIPCAVDLNQAFMAHLQSLISLTRLVINMQPPGKVKSINFAPLPPRLRELSISNWQR